MRKIWAVLTAVLVLLLVACSGITSGRVTGKHYEEAYYYTTQICSGYNAQGTCSMWVPIINYMDERWVLDLENTQGDTGSVSVDEETYQVTEIGSVYNSPQKR